jgi:opacity protein-like surface antigen
MASVTGMALSGADVSLCARSDARFGAKVDLGYSRALSVLKTGHGADVLTYLAGPMFFPSNGNLLTTYVDALFGGARVAGPIPNGAGGFNGAHVQYPAWAFGGGAEYRLSPSLAFRVSVDYLHTHFYNSSQAIRGQNDLRIVNSIVYYFGVPTVNRHRGPTRFHFPLRHPHS